MSAGQRREFSVHVVFNKLQRTGLIISMGVESLGSSHTSGHTFLVEGEASSYWARVEGPTGHVVATHVSGLITSPALYMVFFVTIRASDLDHCS